MPSLKHQPPHRPRPRAGGKNHARRLDPVSQASCVVSSRRHCGKRHHQTQIEIQNLNRHYDSNQQYSITAVSDGGGSVVERYAYSAYGQVTIFDGSESQISESQISDSEISNRYTYTGREWDDGLSLYHYRARMYDAVGGRFVSRDPIGYVDGASLCRAYFAPRSVDPYGLHDPVFDPFREKIKNKFNQFRTLSRCLLEATGLGDFFNKLEDALAQTQFRLHWAHMIGAGGVASARGTFIRLGSIDVADVDEMILIHELVHVYDYIHGINLGGILPPNWHLPGRRNPLYYAENMAYASEYFLNKFEQLSRLESMLAADEDPNCDLQQKEFDGASRIGAGYSIWVKGEQYSPGMAQVVIASEQMGLDFSCKTLLKCIKPHPCCELTYPANDTYSALINP